MVDDNNTTDLLAENSMSAEEFETYIMNEIREEEDIHYNNVKRINDRILKAIGNTLGTEYLNDLMVCLDESEASDLVPFEITKKPFGDFQKDDFGKIKYLWVDQHGPGILGDDYYGTISIELKPFKYLTFNFNT